MKDWPIPDSPVFSSQAKQKFGYVVIFQDTTESVNFAVQMYVPAAEQAEQEEYYRPIKLEERYDRFMEKVRKVQETGESVKKAASVAYKIPDLDIGAIANGLGGPSFSALSAGGMKIAENLVNEAEGYASRFVQRQVSAARMRLQAEAERRLQDWTMAKTEKAPSQDSRKEEGRRRNQD